MPAAIIATPTTRGRRRLPAPLALAIHERAIIDAALSIIDHHLRNTSGVVIDCPQRLKDYMRLQLGGLEHEAFGVMFLDSRHRLIAYEQMFRGTLAHTSVHPREIVKRALALNASAVCLAHNHPSGAAEPSRADELVTQAVKAALQLVDVRVIDHVVVGCGQAMSFAERGLL